MLQKTMIITAIGSAAAAAFLTSAFLKTGSALLESLAITAGTLCYHLVMRLLVGYSIDGRFHNHMDYTQDWFREKPWEKRLYEILRVKGWKDRMPTYNPGTFNSQAHTGEELVMAMCQAEVVHEIIVPLSFLPLFTVRWLGAVEAFLITSILAAAFDLMFVIMQRYNRPRILRILKKKGELRPGNSVNVS